MNLQLKTGREKYPALTGIRAAGATAVFFVHFPMFPGSLIGVNVMAFFYVLSGFLITRIYYEQARWTQSWLSKYFVNRYARIYPVYFLLLTIAVWLRHDYHPWLLFKNYTLIHGLFSRYHDFIIEPSWSLTVEECFYFLAPIFLWLIRKWNFTCSLAAGALLLLAALGISTLHTSFLGTPLFIFSTTFFGHFLEFFAGIYLALLIMKIEKSGASGKKGMRYTVLGFAGIALLVAAMLYVYMNPPLKHYRIVLINNLLIPVPIAVFYFGLMRESTLTSRLLSGKLAGWLGRASYSFYLLHMLVIDYISRPFLAAHPTVSLPLCVLATYILTYLISVLLFFLYEEPLNQLIRKKFKSNSRKTGMTQTLFNPATSE